MQVGVLPAEREGWDCVCSEAGPEPRAPPSSQVQTQLSPFLPLTPFSGVLSIHPPPALKDRASCQSGGAPALRPGALAQSPGREAALTPR